MTFKTFRTIAAVGLIGLAATAATAQNYNVPLAVGADGVTAPIRSDRMLAALARVPAGEYTNNEMRRIIDARRDNDAGLLSFYLSHTNRVSQSQVAAVAASGPVNPMTVEDPNAN